MNFVDGCWADIESLGRGLWHHERFQFEILSARQFVADIIKQVHALFYSFIFTTLQTDNHMDGNVTIKTKKTSRNAYKRILLLQQVTYTTEKKTAWQFDSLWSLRWKFDVKQFSKKTENLSKAEQLKQSLRHCSKKLDRRIKDKQIKNDRFNMSRNCNVELQTYARNK